MKISKVLLLILLLASITILVIAGGKMFPKYASRLIGFGVFLFIDIISWSIFKQYSNGCMLVLKRILNVTYWVPISLFIAFLLISSFIPVQNWSNFFRIYLPGTMVVLFLWKFLLILFLLLGEIIALPINTWKHFITGKHLRKHTWTRFRIFISTGLLTGSSAALIIFLGFFIWVYDFKVHTIEIKEQDLPGDLIDLRIVQLSDIHVGSWLSDKPFQRAIEMVNAQHPDVILFTGDLVNYTTAEAYRFEEALRKLKPSIGVFVVLGNHDYGDYVKWKTIAEHDQNMRDLESFYVKLGWKLLNNSHSVVHRGQDSIAIIGVENWSANKMWGRRGNLKKAISGVENVKTKILLTHDPTHWDKEVLTMYPDILLTLSGHTHAMQMGWELGKYRWSPAEWIFPRWGGIYTARNRGKFQYLNVNRGLGHLGFPGRVGICPEITLLILKKE